MELGVAATGLAGVGTILSAGSQIQAGNEAQIAGNFEASQLNQKANDTVATSQRAAAEQRRQSAILQSRAQAVAAASGAGASDPGVVNIVGDIAKEGEYRALTALYNGNDEARSLRIQAGLTKMQGQQAKQASRVEAVSTILSGGAKAASYWKYK